MRRWLQSIVVMAAAFTMVAALATPGYASTSRGTKAPQASRGGGTVTFALPPQTIPDYIFPMLTPENFTIDNSGQFQQLMYRPLYYFGVGTKAVINEQLSLAKAPVWSADGLSATIHLKAYRWSNGARVTARDVEFWENLVAANKQEWGAYVPGAYPDNVTGIRTLNSSTIKLTFNNRYSHHWVLYNELSQITPLPLAWDKTAENGASGHADLTPSGARAVYKFLSGQASRNVSSYGRSAVWRIVDGPWRLQSLSAAGKAIFVPNRSYSGPIKPKIQKFIEVPYNSNSSEDKALRRGDLTFGWLPANEANQRSKLHRQGFEFSRWVEFGVDYIQINQHNPTVGAMFRQAYIRQALEELLNQQPDAYSVLTCGPVPVEPANPYVSTYEKQCHFKYSPATAVKTLRSHGWHVVPGGISTCTQPGTKPGECGKGVTKGMPLTLNYIYAKGDPAATQGVFAYQKAARKYAGVKFDVTGMTFNQLISAIGPCTASQPSCKWQIADYGGWVYTPDYYPTGEELFASNALANLDNYSNQKMDRLIKFSELAGNDLANLKAYENYASSQVPVLWNSTDLYALAEVRSCLHGVTFNPYLNIEPEEWYFAGCGHN